MLLYMLFAKSLEVFIFHFVWEGGVGGQNNFLMKSEILKEKRKTRNDR